MTRQLTLKVKGEVKNNKIWGILRDGKHLKHPEFENTFSGWVPFIFQQYTGNADKIENEVEIPVKLVNSVFREHSNGGRMNPNTYNSVEEYMADPLVKEIHRIHLAARNDFAKQLQLCGDPEQLDQEITLSYFGAEFTMKQTLWETDTATFEQWFSDFFVLKARELAMVDMFETAEQAVASTNGCDDLFGERFFPVAKFDLSITDLETAKDVCASFKGCSKPIVHDGQAYIGIRSKPSEIWSISEVYDVGGKILKGEEWNW